MTGTIKVLKDILGNFFYPVTHQSAIYFDDGETLEQKEIKRNIVVDNIVADYDAATKANLSVEVTNARGTFPTLQAREDDNDKKLANIVNILTEGVKGDGTNETELIQLALDKAINIHGVFYIPQGITVAVDTLLIENVSDFKIQCDGVLKRIDNGSYDNQYQRSMLNIHGCSNFNIISFNGDGNVINNGITIKEHAHILEFIQCHDFHVNMAGKNLTGDGIYLSDCYNVQSDTIYCTSEDTGRNTLSIISGDKMQFSKIISIGVGTPVMPGGVDAETDTAFESITNIQFGEIFAETIGTAGFSLTNNWGSVCNNVIASNVIVHKKSTIRTNEQYTNTGIVINNFDNCKINGNVEELQTIKTNLSTLGFWVNGGKNNDINISVKNVYKGCIIGYSARVYDSKFNCSIYQSLTNGIETGFISNSIIDISVTNANYGEFTDIPCLLLGFGSIQDNVTYKGKYKKDTFGDVGVRIFPQYIHTGNMIFDIDFSGFIEDKYFYDSLAVLPYKTRVLIWHNLNLVAGWSATGGNMYIPSFTRDINGFVHFRGQATGGTLTEDTTIVDSLPITPSKYVVANSQIYITNFNTIRLATTIIGNVNFDNIQYQSS